MSQDFKYPWGHENGSSAFYPLLRTQITTNLYNAAQEWCDFVNVLR